MSVAFWFEDAEGLPLARTYVSDGVLAICRDLEEKGVLPLGGRRLGFMDGKKGAEVIEILEKAIVALTDEAPNPARPLAATAGNARKCLSQLRDGALKHPQAPIVAWR